MNQSNLDLNEVVRNQTFKFSLATTEDSIEKESRIRIEEANAAHQRQKELLLYRLTGCVILLSVALCCWTVLRKGLAAEEGKLALALLTSIVTGLVGYATGRASK